MLVVLFACAGPTVMQAPVAPRRCYIQAPAELAIEDVCMDLGGADALLRYVRAVEDFKELVRDCDRVNGWEGWDQDRPYRKPPARLDTSTASFRP